MLATLGFHYAFDLGNPALGVAAVISEEGEIEFDGNLWPPEPSLEGFRAVITQEARYLEHFWHQFGNNLFIGLLTMLLTVLIGSLASFAVSRRMLRFFLRSYNVIVERDSHLIEFYLLCSSNYWH